MFYICLLFCVPCVKSSVLCVAGPGEPLVEHLCSVFLCVMSFSVFMRSVFRVLYVVSCVFRGLAGEPVVEHLCSCSIHLPQLLSARAYHQPPALGQWRREHRQQQNQYDPVLVRALFSSSWMVSCDFVNSDLVSLVSPVRRRVQLRVTLAPVQEEPVT